MLAGLFFEAIDRFAEFLPGLNVADQIVASGRPIFDAFEQAKGVIGDASLGAIMHQAITGFRIVITERILDFAEANEKLVLVERASFDAGFEPVKDSQGGKKIGLVSIVCEAEIGSRILIVVARVFRAAAKCGSH